MKPYPKYLGYQVRDVGGDRANGLKYKIEFATQQLL